MGKGTKARRKQYDSGEIVLEQVKLVRDALAEQVGGEDSDACKRATERQKASRDTNGQVDEEAGELNGHGHGETFELDSDTKTVDELLKSVKRKRRKRKTREKTRNIRRR